MWYNYREMDKKYLFKRNNVWWVKLAVPVYLRDKFGFDLRKSTGEKDLEKALLVRDSIISEFKAKFSSDIDQKPSSKTNILNKTTYLDYASTTPVDERVIEKMKECLSFEGAFGNSGSRSHVYGLSLIHI